MGQIINDAMDWNMINSDRQIITCLPDDDSKGFPYNINSLTVNKLQNGTRNKSWTKKRLFTVASKDICKHEEIYTSYGDCYWKFHKLEH